MKARKGEAAEFIVGLIIGLVLGVLGGAAIREVAFKTETVNSGYFKRGVTVYKVTEFSKLEYPEKGTEQ